RSVCAIIHVLENGDNPGSALYVQRAAPQNINDLFVNVLGFSPAKRPGIAVEKKLRKRVVCTYIYKVNGNAPARFSHHLKLSFTCIQSRETIQITLLQPDTSVAKERDPCYRYLSGDSVPSFGLMNGSIVLPDQPTPLLSTPPGLLHLLSHQSYRSERKASPSSLPGRLNRALSLGTIPSLARTDSGYLFSGSRPASRASVYKESPGSDYFSLLSGSGAVSPLPSPTPSVAGSAISSCGSLFHRRPIISPARLNLQGQKLGLSLNRTPTRTSFDDLYQPDSSLGSHEFTPKFSPNTMKLMTEAGSISSHHTPKMDKSSHSSACPVDSTTAFLESPSKWKNCGGMSLTGVFLVLSFTMNLVMIVFFYQK
ncbi:unnamed protein product, partial [Ranitomeya imitator]